LLKVFVTFNLSAFFKLKIFILSKKIKMKKYIFKVSLSTVFFLFTFLSLFSQTEVEPWGNITGIRIDGQLMEFESNISVVQNDWSRIHATGKEKQRPKYSRKGNEQIISSNIDSLYFTETVADAGKGTANINIQLSPKANMPDEKAYYRILLPLEDYSRGTIQLANLKAVHLNSPSSDLDKYLEYSAKSILFKSEKRLLKLIFKDAIRIIINNVAARNDPFIQVFIPLHTGDLENQQTVSKSFTLHASGYIDRKPVNINLNTAITGRPFEGLGGNFRLQNPKVDPEVIDYCLENLRVAWGRVEMPWSLWQPDINTDPITEAKAGRLNLHVQKSMEMAQRLYKMGMPVILTAWAPPAWAIIGKPKFRPGPDGVWGNPLDHSKTNEIYKSITDYIEYLKNEYGVEITDFSFNESDLGINIRQTGEEHAELIKGLGAYFVSRGLKTKLLLGDNSDANTYAFIDSAMSDSSTHPFIGAVSFHSWRGWDSITLQKWADAATNLHLPLLVGEGSIDAAAWAYPAIFEEQTYALKEINLYTRLLAICQPESILQWQLTSDYSPLAGGGVYGEDGPLHPTQRFWNLKQLASIPKGLYAMPIRSGSADVSSAALGDHDKGIYSIQLVNNGAARRVTLTGLPQNVKSLRVFVTNKKRGKEEATPITAKNGKANFRLEATSYVTLEVNK
jgi:hypothetical protein